MWRPNQNHRLENMTFFVRNGADGAEFYWRYFGGRESWEWERGGKHALPWAAWRRTLSVSFLSSGLWPTLFHDRWELQVVEIFLFPFLPVLTANSWITIPWCAKPKLGTVERNMLSTVHSAQLRLGSVTNASVPSWPAHWSVTYWHVGNPHALWWWLWGSLRHVRVRCFHSVWWSDALPRHYGAVSLGGEGLSVHRDPASIGSLLERVTLGGFDDCIRV